MRFSIDNRFRNVALEQFKRTAEKLDSALKQIKSTTSSELLLTTNREDYLGWGSLTIWTPEVEDAKARRERFQLIDLNENLWRRAFEIELFIRDYSAHEPYMVLLSHGVREPKRLFFYSQCLDEASQRVFDSFRKASLLQKIGDGSPKTSQFAQLYALSKFNPLRNH